MRATDYLSNFMMQADDSKHDLVQFTKERLTHKGLYDATIDAYKETFRKAKKDELSIVSLPWLTIDDSLDEDILDAIMRKEVLTDALSALRITDRGDFVSGWIDKKDFFSLHHDKMELISKLIANNAIEIDGNLVRETPYENMPYGLDFCQTCSAPYMVLVYNLLLRGLSHEPMILGEGGAGCLYHAANTANLFPDAQIYSWEVPERTSYQQEILDRLEPRVSERINLLSRNCFSDNAFVGLSHSFDIFYFTFKMPQKNLHEYFDRLNNGGLIIAPVIIGQTKDGKDATALRVYKKETKIRHTDISPVSFVPAVLPD